MVRHLATDNVLPKRRSSAVSKVLRAIRMDAESSAVPSQPGTYRLRVARDVVTRERAYRLAYHVYRASGFADADPRERCVHPYDERPDTFVLLAEDTLGNAVGTVSLVFDSVAQDDAGLPCDEIFGEEVASLRRDKRRVAEVTRLAMVSEQAGGRVLLLTLFHAIFVYAHRVQRVHDFVIEVNPRHAPFYRRLIGFEMFGSERPCPRVKGAPALLLRLDLQRFDWQIRALDSSATPAPGCRHLHKALGLVRRQQTETWLTRTFTTGAAKIL